MCRTVYHCGLKELLRRASIDDVREWQAEFALEPWGEICVDFAGAQISAMVGNAAGGKKSGAPYTVAELLPPWRREQQPRQRKTSKEVMSWLKGYTIACGGKVNGKRPPQPEIPAAKRRREKQAEKKTQPKRQKR